MIRRLSLRLRQFRRQVRRFGPLITRHKGQVALSAAAMIGFILTGLIAPWPIQMVIDGVLLGKRDDGVLRLFASWLPARPEALLGVACLLVVTVAALNGAFCQIQRLTAASVGHRVVAALRTMVFEKLQHLSLAFHERHRTGDLLLRMTGDITLLREIMVPAMLDMLSRLLVLAGMLTLMAAMAPDLTLVAVLMLPLLGLATLRFGSRIRSVTRSQRKKEGRIAGVAAEALNSVAMIQAYSREDEVSRQFSRQNDRSLRAGLRGLRLSETLSRIVEVTLAVGTALVLGLGARRVLAGSMSPGELVVFLAYLKGLYKPVHVLIRTSSKANKAIACGERVLEVLDSPEQVEDLAGAVEAPLFAGEIVFDRVTFGYDPQRPVLRELSFRVGPGETVGLVGPSGSGKSTIAALLLRLYQPQSGRILIDGQDVRSFTLESYRRRLAVVLQEPFLFGATIDENVRQGHPAATPEEVVAAARAAGADGFVRALPEGYETVLGERGASLSRGQQQRISLARALVRRAPLMIFDEPTTGLDARIEAEVTETLGRAARESTCIWIAHDLEQILGCPRVVVLRDGAILQDGPPSRLLEQAGTFRSLFVGERR